MTGEYTKQDARTIRYVRLFMPLSSDGSSVDMVIGAAFELPPETPLTGNSLDLDSLRQEGDYCKGDRRSESGRGAPNRSAAGGSALVSKAPGCRWRLIRKLLDSEFRTAPISTICTPTQDLIGP